MSVNLSSIWRFSYRIVLPVILAVGIAIATIAGFVVWSTAKSDERALGRETHLVAHVIDEEAKSLIKQQDYYSNWDEALTALKNNDIGWIDDNLGSELYDSGHYDRIYVLDPKVRPVYAMYEGGKTDAGNFEADRSVIAPMILKLKGIDAAGAMAAYDNGNTDKVPRVSDMAEVDGRAAFVAIMPIMSDSGDIAQTPGSENFVVCVRFLDAALAKELMDQYLIDNAAFQPKPASDPARASFAVKNAAGDAIAWFVWSPDRPGAQILSETTPAMAGGLAIAGLVLVLLLRGLRRTTSALEAGKAKAEYQAHHDTLTGLANRALFNKRLEEALTSAPRDDSSIALLALDLDRFKQVNDTLGHEAGDQLLTEVGQRLTPLVAPSDTIARLGGDEFAIIQRSIRTPDEASALSNRIIAALGAPFVLAGRIAQIGVSIGIVITPASQAARDLASKADMALYEAKASGRNQFKIFDPKMQEAAAYRETIGAELKAAHLTVPQRVA